MVKFFVEIEFKKQDELYWFPFYIEVNNENEANNLVNRHIAELKERYEVTFVNYEQIINGINSKRIHDYRNKAFLGKPHYIEINRWLLTRDNHLVETPPEVSFQKTLLFELSESKIVIAQEFKKNKFPIQKLTYNESKNLNESEVIVLNIFAR